MSQNNSTILYAGIDVAKATLQLSLAGTSHSIDNDARGHARILKLLTAAENARPGRKVHVILEATGGYEAALCGALPFGRLRAEWHAADRTLSVIQPSRARHFAGAKSEHAKTDKIDADVLTAFGEAIAPDPTPAPSAAQTHLEHLVGRRAQLVDTRTAEINRAGHYSDKLLRAQSRRLPFGRLRAGWLALLERQIAECERAIAAQIAADEAMAARAARLQQVPGVGPIVAATLQAHLPARPSAFPLLSPPPPRSWAASAMAKPPGSPDWHPTTATAAPGKARATSAEDAPPRAVRSTWPR